MMRAQASFRAQAITIGDTSLDLRAVDYLLEIAARGSLRAAAQRLGLSQPALTKAVRRLEDETKVPLLDRRARGVTPTVFGEALLRHARHLRATLRDAEDELAALRLGLGGRVRIGAGPSWLGTLLPAAIERFRRERPEVRLHVTGGMDETLKGQLRDGGLDLVLAAISDLEPMGADLVGRALLEDDYRIVAHVDHPLAHRSAVDLAELLAYPWILPAAGTYMVTAINVVFRARRLPPPEPVIETDAQHLKLQLMRAGPYLSAHAAGQLASLGLDDIRPLNVPGATWRRAAGLILRREVVPSPATSAFVHVLECIASEAG